MDDKYQNKVWSDISLKNTKNIIQELKNQENIACRRFFYPHSIG